MIGLLMSLAVLMFFLWIGCKIAVFLLKAFVWLFILVPVVLIMWCLALICCCTLILIPVGVKIFGTGVKVLLPN